MTADVIHIDSEFQPNPQAPEAVAAAAADGLRIARNTRERVVRIEIGDTEWQQSVMTRFDGIESALKRIDANLSILVAHVRSRTVAANGAASVRPLALDGLGGE